MEFVKDYDSTMTPMTDSALKLSPVMVGPTCVLCDVPMFLARAMPFEDEQELHIFECHECRQSQSEVVNFD